MSQYVAEEIPGWQQFGLTPGRMYSLLRPGDELEKAVSTFDRLPILRDHTEVTASNHKPDMVIGATGSDAAFNPSTGELTNSLVIWDQAAIDAIQNGTAKSLSCGYRYVARMQPGSYRGQPHSLTMTQIKANHLVTCSEPRVSGAIVGDANPDWKDTQMNSDDIAKLLTFLRDKLEPDDYSAVETMIAESTQDPAVITAMDARRRAVALVAGAADIAKRHPGLARIRRR